jgi:four helix bundle protein
MGRSYRDLVVWQKAMDLVLKVYAATESFPRAEQFGLTSQMRRAAVSLPSNIAEGQARRTSKEFRQFLGQARGSLMELETQILMARQLRFLDAGIIEGLLSLCAEVGRLLNGLMLSLPQ